MIIDSPAFAESMSVAFVICTEFNVISDELKLGIRLSKEYVFVSPESIDKISDFIDSEVDFPLDYQL